MPDDYLEYLFKRGVRTAIKNSIKKPTKVNSKKLMSEFDSVESESCIDDDRDERGYICNEELY